jgi:hypothetical protein
MASDLILLEMDMGYMAVRNCGTECHACVRIRLSDTHVGPTHANADFGDNVDIRVGRDVAPDIGTDADAGFDRGVGAGFGLGVGLRVALVAAAKSGLNAQVALRFSADQSAYHTASLQSPHSAHFWPPQRPGAVAGAALQVRRCSGRYSVVRPAM